jgi:hypothetical protein
MLYLHIILIIMLDYSEYINPLNAELNPICHLLVLLGAHHIFHVSGLTVNDGIKKYKPYER